MYTHGMEKFDHLIDDVVSRCAAVRTLSAARAVTRHYDDALRSVGLTITQFTLLVTIAKVTPQSISEIGELLSMDRTSVSRNLSLLEREGLVTRGGEAKSRKRPVNLTPEGEAKLRDAYHHWQQAQDEIERKFDGSEFDQVMATLRMLRKVG